VKNVHTETDVFAPTGVYGGASEMADRRALYRTADAWLRQDGPADGNTL
jgi:hypothetical protein